ncbi:MAG: folate family ECF transporter S component [Eubacteriales bacterium]|nr:folate family ECF transporter S component [Eubacteriales bacterium]MDD3536973.1 folate family ECF transporter S component [Eubacteriales bacterium]NLV70083.1 folate family ECF transporter S component [Clostridiales bacterium]HPF19117.1 folate family ECF transporter S component [Bacillota bacterium]
MHQRNRTSLLTGMALLATVSLVLTRFLSFYVPFLGVQSMRVGFGEVPVILAGLLMGGPAGGLTGLAADLVGATLFPAGPYFPGFTLSAFLTGFLPVILMKRMSKKEQSPGKAMLFLSILLTQLVTSALLNTLWIVLLYMAPFSPDKYWALFVVRAPFAVIMTLVYTVVVYPLYSRLAKEGY